MTDRGRSIHLSSCRKKHHRPSVNPVAAAQPPASTSSHQPVINHQRREIRPPDPQIYTPIWGKLSCEDAMQTINSIYDEIVFWRKDIFLLPSGAA